MCCQSAVIVLAFMCLYCYICYVDMSQDFETWTRWRAYRWKTCSLAGDFVYVDLRCYIVDDDMTT